MLDQITVRRPYLLYVSLVSLLDARTFSTLSVVLKMKKNTNAVSYAICHTKKAHLKLPVVLTLNVQSITVKSLNVSSVRCKTK